MFVQFLSFFIFFIYHIITFTILPTLSPSLSPSLIRHPHWVKWTKKVIVEDGHSVAQLTHIWCLLIRNRDIFYSARAQFIPQMVNSLTKLGLPNTRPVDNKRIALDLADLVISWDRRCVRDLEVYRQYQLQSQQVFAL